MTIDCSALTREQTTALRGVLSSVDGRWLTVPGSANHARLLEWQERGWFSAIDGFEGALFEITESGRRALAFLLGIYSRD